MQTISCYFLSVELPEIREVVKTLDEVEIISEVDVPDSDLLHVTFILPDASHLFTIGLIVGNNKAAKTVENILKNLKPSTQTETSWIYYLEYS